MNVRMVNATFEDRKKPDFDPQQNTDHFIQKIPEYVAAGIRAFTLNLQGGMPGYEGAVNSAFDSTGALRSEYLRRIERVIDFCDKLGVVVILGCFYQRQDQILQGETAVINAVKNTTRWIRKKGFSNVLLEIANEYPHRGFDHEIIRTPEGVVELIRIAKREHPNLLVSASGVGNGKIDSLVAETSDFILIHFNGTPISKIPERVNALKKFHKPIVCNEDDKVGKEAVHALKMAVASGCSWGYMNNKINQYVPFEFNGVQDDTLLYQAMRRLTRPEGSRHEKGDLFNGDLQPVKTDCL